MTKAKRSSFKPPAPWRWTTSAIREFIGDYTARHPLSMKELCRKYGRSEPTILWRAGTLGVVRHPDYRADCSERAGWASGRARRAKSAALKAAASDQEAA